MLLPELRTFFRTKWPAKKMAFSRLRDWFGYCHPFLVLLTQNGRCASNTVEILDSISVQSFKTDADRYEAKEAAIRLLARLETPFERLWALSFENPVLIADLKLYQDLDVWSKWASKPGNEGGAQSLDNILKMCDVPVQPNLLRKLEKFILSCWLFLIFDPTGSFLETPRGIKCARGDGS